ncbi:MAG: lipopolysaccharide transport periplasmic protein LptA [Burkholderiaceae bacterium]
MNKTIFSLLGLVLLMVPLSIWAEKADRDKPMNIEADRLDHDELKQISIFKGRVVATKGTLILRGALLEVRQDPEGYQYGVMTPPPGERAFYRQKREGLNEWMEGEADRIEYDGKADRVTLIQRSELRRYRGTELSDEMHGQRIVYENLTDQFIVDGKSALAGPSTGRIRAVLTPKKKEDKP